MIRNLLNSARQRISNNSGDTKTDNDPAVNLQVEPLEERLLLTFIGFFDGVTLDINQTADDGDVLIENTTGVWRATDNTGTFTFVAASNIEVNLLDDTVNELELAVDMAHDGDITLNLGNGARDVFFLGTLNEWGGDLNITGGDNTQNINLAEDPAAPLIVHGSIDINLGEGFDTVTDNDKLVTIDEHLSLTGVNDFKSALMVGLFGPPITPGNVSIDTSNEEIESFIDISGTILGSFTFTGGEDIDHIDSTANVRGITNIDIGLGNPFFGDPQNVDLLGTHQDNVIIVADDSILGNEINLLGNFTGNIVSYTGGDLVDIVTYSFVGEQADVFATMGAGDDIFDLTVPVNLLEIDFGNDLGDEFINNVGPVDFEFDITNFHFFNHFYTAPDDTLKMVQLVDTGNVVIDNDAGLTGFDWRLTTGLGGVAATARAENLVLTMLSNTGNDVEVDLFNPVIASITIDVGDGDRDISFTGIANNPLRDIRITAGAGNQNVDLSVNQPLGVATLDINLGTGFDTVDDNANSLIIDEDLVFTGVNSFIHDGLLSVFRDAIIDTTIEVEDTIFDSNGSMFVGRFFHYRGGDGADDLQLNGVGGTAITREANIDLGDSTGGLNQQILLDSADVSFGETLTIRSSNSLGSDLLTTHPGAEFNDDIDIDLGDGLNIATIVGEYTGSSHVMYTGGSDVDNVVYGLTGNPVMLTVMLGAGDDTLEILAGANLSSPLIVDFGTGNDTFINGLGNFTFDAILSNLQGFNHNYVFATNQLTSTQIADQGSVSFDNGAPGQAFRVMHGAGTSVITAADNLVVNLLDNSGNVVVELDNAHAGDVEVNLGNGSRNLQFTGTNNSITGNLNVNAGTGDQNVHWSSNNHLAVGGNVSVNLGSGNDTVDEQGNDTNIAGFLSFVGVNVFENNGSMTVGGNLTVDNSGQTANNIFDDDATMNIGGNFNYTGGDGRDDITLNGVVGGTTIGGNAIIDVGANVSGGTQLIWFNSALSNVTGSLNVTSSDGTNSDSFRGDAGATFGGNIDVDLGDGTNEAIITGIFGGSSIDYMGGTGADTVTLGTTGNSAQVDIQLGAGDDSLDILAGTQITSPLFVDFGTGDDTFVNGLGDFTFSATLLNLDGFNHEYDHAGDSLMSTQVSDPGIVTVNNSGAGAIRFVDGGTNVLATVTNLTIHMMDNTSNLNIRLDNTLAGDLEVNLGDGARTLNLLGADNSIGGDLLITGGSGDQLVNLAVNNALDVGGVASIDLGSGNDRVDESGNDITIGTQLDFKGVNRFTNDATLMVNGGLIVDNSGQTDRSWFIDNGTLNVTGDFNYTGSDVRDEVLLEGAGGSTIGGQAIIHLGDNTAGGPQSVKFGPGSSTGGLMNATSTNAASSDTFTSDATTSFGGDIKINFGDGTNTATIFGVLGGSEVSYVGGSGVDTVNYATTGTPAEVNIVLGSGGDTFTLEPGAVISPTTLRVDFGGGTDTFTNNYGNFDFNANLLNLDGLNYHYDHAASNLRIVQVANSGNITVANNGTGGAIRVINDGTVEIAPVNDIRVTLLSNTDSDLFIDYDNAFAGDTIIELKNGDRNVRFVGTNNSIGGFLRIDSGSIGDQNIFLAVNSDLNVGESAVINLRGGIDMIDDGANNLTIGKNLIMRSVNTFRNENTLNITGNLTMNTRFDNEASVLDNNGIMNIGGNLSYFGGNKADRVFLQNTDIDGVLNIDLGSGDGTQIADFTGNTSMGRMRVFGGNTIGTNRVLTDAATVVDTDVVVNFSNSNAKNVVTLLGNYGGTYGSFRGGSGIDLFTFGATANDMHFVTRMGANNDRFTLASSAILMSTLLDFGSGNDIFDDEIGEPYPFPVTIKNLA